MTTEMQPQGLDLNNPNQQAQEDGPVECLGKSFENDQARRDYYLEILAEKLRDPGFRKIEGFPIGDDEDILELSDPPYYTACPNPFFEEFIQYYGRPYNSDEGYKREPYAADVSEGRSGLFYDAHSYHTKVPHKAVMRYLLHYTEPGDVVMDSFAGTGMAGVAAGLCGNRIVVEELGYKVDIEGNIYESHTSKEPFSKLGERYCLINDLSPAASFISANFNKKTDYSLFESEAEKLFEKANDSLGWLYSTSDSNEETILLQRAIDGDHVIKSENSVSQVNYTIWSDVYECGNCASELVFWDEFYNDETNKLDNECVCGSCGSTQTKRTLTRKFISQFDQHLKKVVQVAQQIPVLIDYTNTKGDRKQKAPEPIDLALIEHIEKLTVDVKVRRLPFGINTEQPRRSHGIEYIHQFYTAKNLYILEKLRELARNSVCKQQLLFLISSYDLSHSTKMTRIIFKKGKKPVLTGYQSGTLYVSSLPIEKNIITGIYKQKLPTIKKSLNEIAVNNVCQVGSATQLLAPSDSLDYIFIDPPFGANINYSELNSLAETSLGVMTENTFEAVENRAQNKDLNEYRSLMKDSFAECYRLLKPGHWMTVEFSNTSAAVWNSIQESLTVAGFIIANVSALSKQQSSFKAVTTPTAVKQDLAISAYKPNGGFKERFERGAEVDNVWDFINTHLSYLPVIKRDADTIVFIPERDPRILFDQLVSYFVKHLRDVPLSSGEFQLELYERYAKRDGMIFLLDQVVEYDKAKQKSESKVAQISIFVNDEASAIEWLRKVLLEKPQTYQDIHPKFLGELSGWKKGEEQLELSRLLEQNFLKCDGVEPIPAQIHGYLSTNFKDLRGLDKKDMNLLSKAKGRWYVPNPDRDEDLQKLREKDLLKQFEVYKAFTGKKIKALRIEAVRCGFKQAWQARDYDTIVKVANKLPDYLLQEDQKLLMWYDQSMTRRGV